MDVLATLLKRIDDYDEPLWLDEATIFKRNALLQQAGEVNTKLYLVIDGALQIFYETESYFSTIRFAYRNSLFASLDSFITGKPSVYSIRAIRKTTLRVMEKEPFLRFLASDPENLQLWNTILSYTIVSLLERETDLLATSPRERYERVLQRSPLLFQEVPLKHIASYLRMAPETLSRLRKS